MTRRLFSVVLLAATLAAPAAHAACYADYKAKRDNPLRLHYGVMQVNASPCASSPSVRADIERRLAAAGWTLLQVEGVFGDGELNAKRRDAGEFFLRF